MGWISPAGLLGLAVAERAFAVRAVAGLCVCSATGQSQNGAGREDDVFNVFHVLVSFPTMNGLALAENNPVYSPLRPFWGE